MAKLEWKTPPIIAGQIICFTKSDNQVGMCAIEGDNFEVMQFKKGKEKIWIKLRNRRKKNT